MKLKHLTILFTLGLFVLVAAFNKPEQAALAQNASVTSIDLTEILTSMEDARRNKRLESIKTAIIQYNPDIKDKTVNTILTAIEAFDLDDAPEMYAYSIYQILYESRGRHTDKNGKIITSSANALGITQIRPVTAFHYLSMEMDSTDHALLQSLGADKIKFGDRDKVYKHVNEEGKTLWITPDRTLNKVSKWLENPTNGILLWGYIMRHNTNKYGHYNALVIYNAGKGGWQHYKTNHASMWSHAYLRGIRKVQNHLKTKKATLG